MHGGAEGAGGQPGNKNASIHGRYSKETLEEEEILRNIFEKFSNTKNR